MDGFSPLVAEWFVSRFGTPTEPQALGWPAIRAGRDTLVAAPTGSGKTLAAFLSCIDALVQEGLATGALPDETRVLYISPLKALGNDVQKNLDTPLAEIAALAASKGIALPPIRTAVRTGDTLAKDRARHAKHPPHILITTPESAYILLTSESGRRMLGTVTTVVVDEIHAVARDKRGQHLALSLERLDRLVTQGGGVRPIRIGLSATQRPIEAIGRFLVGARAPEPAIVDCGHFRTMDVAVEVPDDELAAVASKEQWQQVEERIAALVLEHRTTLVFVDTRRIAERLTHALGKRLGEDAVAAHHGSLSRATRLLAEQRLKNAQIRVCVATASLELGIDVGAVELVCLVGAPRSFAAGLQRIGRAGHWRGAIPKARIFPMTRDGLVDTAAFLRGMRDGMLERTCIPTNARDVLSQQIVAMTACEPIGEDELFDLVRGATPYANLPRDELDAVIEVLSEGIATRRGRTSAWLHRDGVHRILRGRRGSRLAAITSGGAIPDNANYAVVADPDEVLVGTIEEDFAIESMAGDVFLLGNTSWRIRRVEAGRVRVEDAHGAAPTIPFWLGDGLGRTTELSAAVGTFRSTIEPLLDDVPAAEAWVVSLGLPLAAAKQLVAYLRASRAVLGALPTQDRLVAERFFDDSGGMQIVVHAPFGQRLNRAFGLALRKRFCRSFDFELQAAATDDGVLLSIGPQHSFPLESIFDFVHADEARDVLEQAALQAPMFGVRWRWNATRALAILRSNAGKKVPPPLLRMRSDDLLAAVFPAQVACQDNAAPGPIEVPDHPLCRETLDDCLHDAMDLTGLERLLSRIAGRQIALMARDVAEPSPLAHEIVNSRPYTYLDDAPLEERRARAVSMRRSLPPQDAALGALDPEAIATVVAQVWPDPRDEHELHDVLLTLIAIPVREAREWAIDLDRLRATGRASIVGGAWVATERLPIVRGEQPATAIVRGWMGILGPITASALAERLQLDRLDVDVALAVLEGDGLLLQGRFTAASDEVEWCERGLLARIHRLTLGRLRREIEPVSPSVFLRFLSRWQHVHPGTQLQGREGLREAIGQLAGMEVPIAAWEADVLRTRVAGYDPAWLDDLCATGAVAWARLAPGEDVRRAPSRNAPIALFPRDDLDLWPLEPTDTTDPLAARVIELLERRGALFAGEIARGTGWPADKVADALWGLVAAGRVTGDGFAGLRALAAGDRGLGSGRWSLVRPEPPGDRLERLASLYLRRWGVVFRDVLAREVRPPPWRDLVQVLRRREARGELRGGRFVNGFVGEQFALPEAVDALRTVRRTAPDHEHVDLCAGDPLNLVGILTPGPRVPAVLHQRVRYLDGLPEVAAK